MAIELNYNWNTMKTYKDVESFWADHEEEVKKSVSDELYHEWLRVTALAFRVRSIFVEIEETMPAGLLATMVEEIGDGLEKLGKRLNDNGYHVHEQSHVDANVQIMELPMSPGAPLPPSGTPLNELMRRIAKQTNNTELLRRLEEGE